MPGTWSSIASICSSKRTVAYAVCSTWADRGVSICSSWADRGSNQCRTWADQGSNQCSSWADKGKSECSSWADKGHNNCCDWWPCSWACDAFYWVANWVCQGWYWVANWVCQAWYWVAKWVCLAWYWVAKWVCVASYWLAKWICLAWQWVTHLICSGNAGPVWLMTDGSILLNENSGGYGTHNWWKLAPDANGNYTAAWTQVSSSNVARKYFASAVLADGRLFVCGGEYSDSSGSQSQDEAVSAEIYDPVADSWTLLPSPPGATQIGDAPLAVLPDGRVLLGEIDNTTVFVFTPGPDTWTTAATKGTRPSEESWVLMPDSTIVTVRTDGSGTAEKYDIASDTWVSAGNLPANIVENASAEIGPGILLPDGRAFFLGANANLTALYTPGATSTATGSWSAGPVIPTQKGDANPYGSKDGPGALLPGGKILFPVAPVDGSRNNYLSGMRFFETDGTVITRVTDPPNPDGETYKGRLLPLPNGDALWAREDRDEIYAYTNPEAPQDAWRPIVDKCPRTIVPGSTFTLTGRQLNGMSQAQGYGDDYAASTNYPLVRIRNVASGVVRYCRTSDHTSMGVATGLAAVSTTVHVPADLTLGRSVLEVVANGIASKPQRVNVIDRDHDDHQDDQAQQGLEQEAHSHG
ncbi:MAG: kelch repeat-containing protein [Jatrophihabitans sp.]